MTYIDYMCLEKKEEEDSSALKIKEQKNLIAAEYMFRKDGGRGLVSIKDHVDTLIQGFEDFIKRNKENIIAADYICLEKKEEEDSSALKIAWIY